MERGTVRWLGRVVAVSLLIGGTASAQSQHPEPEVALRQPVRTPQPSKGALASELQAGQWSGGGGVGVIGSTPDGSAVGMEGHADYFISERVSIGPLVQAGFTGDLAQVGLSTQGKYWVPLPGTGGRGKAVLQSGIGFVHADFLRSDTSWLVPLGIGYDYTLDSGTSLTATTLVNFTNLNTGLGTGADVMPGFLFGIRF